MLKELYQELMRRGNLIRQKESLEGYHQAAVDQLRGERKEYRKRKREWGKLCVRESLPE